MHPPGSPSLEKSRSLVGLPRFLINLPSEGQKSLPHINHYAPGSPNIALRETLANVNEAGDSHFPIQRLRGATERFSNFPKATQHIQCRTRPPDTESGLPPTLGNLRSAYTLQSLRTLRVSDEQIHEEHRRVKLGRGRVFFHWSRNGNSPCPPLLSFSRERVQSAVTLFICTKEPGPCTPFFPGALHIISWSHV